MCGSVSFERGGEDVKQLLVTLAVLAVVIAIARLRRPGPAGRGQQSGSPRPQSSGTGRWPPSSMAAVGYSFLAIMVVIAAIVFYSNWQTAHEVVTIRVLDTRSGDTATYHVYRKDAKGRSFHTVDGRYISLGAGDRMERIDEQ